MSLESRGASFGRGAAAALLFVGILGVCPSLKELLVKDSEPPTLERGHMFMLPFSAAAARNQSCVVDRDVEEIDVQPCSREISLAVAMALQIM